jgi:two-component SAPR family response regulator
MDVSGNFQPKLEEKRMDCWNKKEKLGVLASTYNQLTHIKKEDKTLDFAEYLFRYGVEVLEQTENNRYFSILNRSLLALVYSKKGQWGKALTIGEKALHDALSQGGEVAPICKMVLSVILMEKRNFKEAGGGLMDSAALLREMDRQTPLEKNNQATVGNKSLKTAKFENKPDTISHEDSNSYLFRLQMFGPFRVFYHHEEIKANSWRTVKSRDLLAYLAHQNKPVSTDQIMEALWPGTDPDKSSALFHTTLYYLRRLLQQFTKEEIIIRGSKRYQLRPGSILIDRVQYEAVAQKALKKTITTALVEELEAVAMLYRGDYLEDLDYQWVTPIQEELRNINYDLKQRLAVYYLQNRLYSRALTHLRQIMAENPYSEEVLRLLLTTLAKMGDLTAVKKEYAVFAKTILKDIGIRPSSKITALYKAINDINLPKSMRIIG